MYEITNNFSLVIRLILLVLVSIVYINILTSKKKREAEDREALMGIYEISKKEQGFIGISTENVYENRTLLIKSDKADPKRNSLKYNYKNPNLLSNLIKENNVLDKTFDLCYSIKVKTKEDV